MDRNGSNGFLLKPLRRGVVAGILGFVTLFLILPAVGLVWMAFCPDQSAWGRWSLLGLAAVLLAFPGRIAWVSVRRRFRSGRWSASEDERLELRRKWGGKPISPWIRYADRSLGIIQLLMAIVWVWKEVSPHSLNWRSVGIALGCSWVTLWTIRNLSQWGKRGSGESAG